MHKLNLIYILSFLLLISIPKREDFKRAKSIYIGEKFHQNVAKSFKDKTTRALFLSMTLGDKGSIPRKVKKKYQNLNLIHLFTPSGIHFAALYFFLVPIFRRLRKDHRKSYIISSALLTLIPYFCIGGFFALKRIALFRSTQNLASKKYFSMFSIFGLTFILDYFFGTYSLSPISFTASFLFLGAIITTKEKKWLPFTLLGGQIILSYYFVLPLTTTGFIFSFFLTSLFSIIYPFIFINFLLLFFMPLSFSGLLIEYFNNAVTFFSQISGELGFFYPSITLMIATLFFSTKLKLIGVFLILLHSDPTFNLSRYRFTRGNHYPQSQDFKKEKYKKIKRSRGGYSVITQDNRKCRILIFTYYLEREC